MNEGEQGGQGPEGGTPSVLRHSLSPLVSHPPLYSASRGPPQPLLPPRRRRPLQNPPGRSARKQRGASVAFPSPPPAPPPPASPELSVAQTSPPGPAVPARPSPHAPRTLSNPLGSRRLFREQTLAAAGAGAARLGAGRRRGARRLVLTLLLPRPGREGAAGSCGSFLGGVGGQTGWCKRLQPTPFKGTRATASRVSVPRSPPPPPRYDMSQAFFLGAWRSPPSSPSPHLGSPPALVARAL
ncbi:atherin-like [Panthera tigris]|uniref:atherin-like n=1 Tax=Panthera tigris TaxID=9694 RepID=UPI001C6FC05F|nr:atherin-like [Panthera tigris]